VTDEDFIKQLERHRLRRGAVKLYIFGNMNDEARVDYIHAYTQKMLADNETSVAFSTAKLSLTLLCSAILAGTSPDPLSALAALPCGLCAIAGMLPGSRLGAAPPSYLMERREEGMETKNLKLVVAKTWMEELDAHSDFRDGKAKWAKRSLLLLGFALLGRFGVFFL